jgi:hypothetical protein
MIYECTFPQEKRDKSEPSAGLAPQIGSNPHFLVHIGFSCQVSPSTCVPDSVQALLPPQELVAHGNPGRLAGGW